MRSRSILVVVAIVVACGGPAATPTPTPTANGAPTGSQSVTPGGSSAPIVTATPATDPTDAPTDAPTATADPEPSLAYECPLVTLEEITALTGRALFSALSTDEYDCRWHFLPLPGETGGDDPGAWFHKTGGYRAQFEDYWAWAVAQAPENIRYAPDLADGAYWMKDRAAMEILYGDRVFSLSLDDFPGSEEELYQLATQIVLAALPRIPA